MTCTQAPARALVRLAVMIAPAMILSGCVSPSGDKAAADPQSAFMARLAAHCGKAYAGRLVSTDPADADMAGRAMVVDFRECAPDRMAIPFHVQAEDGTWDRSRTWLVTRTDSGLRLKHDHRHEDGSADPVTMYGGDTQATGSAGAQDFAVDADSIALFRAGGLAASVTNVWRIEVDGSTYTYQLSRKGRLFRVEFDLTRPVTPPPAPWGW
ncbi:MAG: hypothetical protein KAF27_10360 [Porphyrobacter sp.]|nr:hypothetical protein [Porphyrobacter sp.]